EDGSYEEFNLRAVGMLCAKDLPPQLEPINFKHAYKKQFLTQSVKISGLSSEPFQRILQGIAVIHQHMSRSFKDGTMQDWTPSEFQGHPTIDVASRYFTPTRDLGISLRVPFDSHVDLKKILTKLVDDKWVHTPDNVVEYCQVIRNEGGKLKYVNCDPAVFRIGDIVEVDIGFIAIPIASNQVRLSLMLCSLSLLDATYSDVSILIMHELTSILTSTERIHSAPSYAGRQAASPNQTHQSCR
ncbi:hypothetical protein OE88DRAFT_1640182, partial [Heliocybe sulcata]